MKAAIFYNNYFDADGQELRVGGIETYLRSLASLCRRMDIKPILFQHANRNFDKTVDDLRVVGLSLQHKRSRVRTLEAFKLGMREVDARKDIVIFGSERHAISYDSQRCVSIQHGISWDLPCRCYTSSRVWQNPLMRNWIKPMARRRAIRDYERCPNRVCVDYNFLNWYRTFLKSEVSGHNWVIPNFTDIPDAGAKAGSRSDETTIKILFARRFREARGTRLMEPVVNSLLKKHPNISFTFAGEGTDESWLKSRFAGEKRVVFMKYHPNDAIDIHLQHHIAVVPSIASEGTSLSLAEAMACGCAVVATSIGGMTNMIIDGYNGKLCMPAAADVERAIEELIVNGQQRRRLGQVAYETAKSGFSKEKWEKSWSQVIKMIASM